MRGLQLTLFFLLNSFIFFLGISGYFGPKEGIKVVSDTTADNEQSFFRQVKFYSLEKKTPKLSLSASEVLLTNNGKNMHFSTPQGKTFDKKQNAILYQALKGDYNTQKEQLTLKEDGKITLVDGDIEANYIQYLSKEERLKARGHVKTHTHDKNMDKIYIESKELTARAKLEKAKFRGEVRGSIKRHKVYEPSIDFESDSLEFDGGASLISLNGNVSIKKESFHAQARNGEIFLENYNKKLKYFVLYDDVRVNEKVQTDGISFTRKALAEKLEGIISEELIVLTGYPRVYQQEDIIKGSRIILRENNEVVEVDDANTNFILK